MDIETRALLIFAFIGIVAGFIASLLLGGGGGLLRYLLTGIIGAFVGGYLFDVLKIDLGIPQQDRVARSSPHRSAPSLSLLLARFIA